MGDIHVDTAIISPIVNYLFKFAIIMLFISGLLSSVIAVTLFSMYKTQVWFVIAWVGVSILTIDTVLTFIYLIISCRELTGYKLNNQS